MHSLVDAALGADESLLPRARSLLDEGDTAPAEQNSAAQLSKHMRDVLQNLGEHDPDNRREFKNLERAAPAAKRAAPGALVAFAAKKAALAKAAPVTQVADVAGPALNAEAAAQSSASSASGGHAESDADSIYFESFGEGSESEHSELFHESDEDGESGEDGDSEGGNDAQPAQSAAELAGAQAAGGPRSRGPNTFATPAAARELAGQDQVLRLDPAALRWQGEDKRTPRFALDAGSAHAHKLAQASFSKAFGPNSTGDWKFALKAVVAWLRAKEQACTGAARSADVSLAQLAAIEADMPALQDKPKKYPRIA